LNVPAEDAGGPRSEPTGDGSLAVATLAFAVGDFHRVRREAERVLADAASTEHGEARALLGRMAPDPVIVWLTVGTAAVLGLTVALTVG
jgi:hypothetical protein